jgi:hypothetical protein
MFVYASSVVALTTSLLLPALIAAVPTPITPQPKRLESRQETINDYSCKSTTHPNPVVLLHGLGATYYEDLNVLQAYLQNIGYCTFSLTYGDYDGFPYVGGLKPIAESSQEIGEFISDVKAKTRASKIDIVGHSEGAFQALYTPKFAGVADIVDKIVAIAPPIHGTTFGGATNIRDMLGPFGIGLTNKTLNTVGCAACSDLIVGGLAVQRLNDGKIVQPGNSVTIIASKYDELVTPPLTATYLNETGVKNIYVQDICPLDHVGHLAEAYDTNVWNMVTNALNSTPSRKFVCAFGPPVR